MANIKLLFIPEKISIYNFNLFKFHYILLALLIR